MQRSGMYRAGEILLLVGAILSAFVALLMLLAAGGLSLAFGADGPFPALLALYSVWSALAVGGSIVGFLAWNKARNGLHRNAFVLGMVASFLPPVQVVVLLGAILLKVSPEASAGPAPPSTPSA